MYDAVGTSFDGGPEVNEENASDSPIENKLSPSAIPRYMSCTCQNLVQISTIE